MKPLMMVLAFACLFAMLGLGISFARTGGPPSMFVSGWTRSYQLYKQPHAIWLDQYKAVGDNLPIINKALSAALEADQTPEFVVYAIPLRDLGQSSEGGFANYEDYLADNRLNAAALKKFIAKTGLVPHVYLEPDSIPLAVQYKRDNNANEESSRIYQERVSATRQLIRMYKDAGARVYLEAGHSGWFDYGEADVQRIANALNDAGIAMADGLATNVSNRQPVTGGDKNELHYLKRLVPMLANKHLDVIVDTSRNGGATKARIYHLAEGGKLYDNETPEGRLVGSWSRDFFGETWLHPFFGPRKALSRLLDKEKYTYNESGKLLTAPAWLDAVGDVKPGPAPTDHPPAMVASVIRRYRYIKPPDDCDGALNCPPGWSKDDINRRTAQRQSTANTLSMINWE